MRRASPLATIAAVTVTLLMPTFLDAGEGEKRGKRRRGRDPEKMMERLDTDGDGKLTLAEFVGGREGKRKERAENVFARLDKNEDGVVTLDELKDRSGKRKRKGKRKRRPEGDSGSA